MSDTTSNTRVILGQKVQYTKKGSSSSSTVTKLQTTPPSITVVCKNRCGVTNVPEFYVRVDFKSAKKREAYKKINRILGDR